MSSNRQRCKYNIAKLRVFMTLYYFRYNLHTETGLSCRELAFRAGVSLNYLRKRIRLWCRWKYLRRKQSVIAGKCNFFYVLDKRGKKFVEGVDQELLNRQTAFLVLDREITQAIELEGDEYGSFNPEPVSQNYGEVDKHEKEASKPEVERFGVCWQDTRTAWWYCLGVNIKSNELSLWSSERKYEERGFVTAGDETEQLVTLPANGGHWKGFIDSVTYIEDAAGIILEVFAVDIPENDLLLCLKRYRKSRKGLGVVKLSQVVVERDVVFRG